MRLVVPAAGVVLGVDGAGLEALTEVVVTAGGAVAVTVAVIVAGAPDGGSGSGTAGMLVIEGGGGKGNEGDDGGAATRGGAGSSDFELFASSRTETMTAHTDNVTAADTAATTMPRRLRRFSSST